MDTLRGIDIIDGSLPFRIAQLEAAADRSIAYLVDWPKIAAELVASGADAPSLVELASQYADADTRTIRRLVLASGEDLNLGRPLRDDAVRCLGLIFCRAFAEDLVTPSWILDVVVELTDYGQLDWDVYLVFTPLFEWKEIASRRTRIETRVKGSARELLDRASESLESMILRLTTGAPLA